jgi:ketosteroid isomerase-like protein
MSQADIQMLRAVYDAFGRQDWAVVRSNSLPDFELKLPEALSATYHVGVEARNYFEELFEPFEEVVAEPEKFFERDDQIAVFAVTRLRPRGGSAVVEIRGGQVWTIRDGKLARCEVFRKPEQALEAVGLSAQDAHADS